MKSVAKRESEPNNKMGKIEQETFLPSVIFAPAAWSEWKIGVNQIFARSLSVSIVCNLTRRNAFKWKVQSVGTL